MNITSIFNELNNNFNNLKIDIIETFHELNIEVSSNSLFTITPEFIYNIINILPSRDTLFSLTLKFDDYDEISYHESIEDFISEQNDNINMFSPSECTIFKIQITKIMNSSIISIYSPEHFAQYLSNISIMEILINLSNKASNSLISFEFIDNSLNFSIKSNLLIFKTLNLDVDSSYIVNHSIIESFKNSCNFLCDFNHIFTPDDFNIENDFIIDFNSTLKKLRLVYSLIYIFDISNIKDNILYLNLKGYKSLDLSINLDNIDLNNSSLANLDVYYNIYNWIYTDGNISDKIGIARNVISLYLTDSNSINIHESVFSAIKSNYNIYLTQNVEKYLEVKSKIIELILSINNQISESINSLTQNLVKNLGAISTFIVSITIMNSLNDKRLENIFTQEITIISLILLLLSIIYFKHTIYEYEENKKRIQLVYDRLKNSYRDILVDRDIDRLFNDTAYINDDLLESDKKVKKYRCFWVSILSIFLFTIIILGLIIPLY